MAQCQSHGGGPYRCLFSVINNRFTSFTVLSVQSHQNSYKKIIINSSVRYIILILHGRKSVFIDSTM